MSAPELIHKNHLLLQTGKSNEKSEKSNAFLGVKTHPQNARQK